MRCFHAPNYFKHDSIIILMPNDILNSKTYIIMTFIVSIMISFVFPSYLYANFSSNNISEKLFVVSSSL